MVQTDSAHMRRLLEDRQKNLFSDAHCAKIELTDVVQVLRGKERHLKMRWAKSISQRRGR